MNNIYITSDTHFFHTNIAGPSVSSWKSGYRNFSSVEEMNETLYENINSLVKENDILYHIGDWSFGGKDKIPLSRSRINSRQVHLCLGNHDSNIKKNKDLQQLFSSCSNELRVKCGSRHFFLNHYAHKVWENSSSGIIHCYGHSHASLPDDLNSLSMDVGVDTCLFGHKQYTPYHIEEIIHIMDNCKKFKPIDHHI